MATRVQLARLAAGAAIVWALGLSGSAAAAEWPKHFGLDKESRSPDGHYGIVAATSEHVHDGKTLLLEEEGESFIDYFADLKRHRLLGKIKGFEYVEGENHAHMDTLWSEDSKLCVATYWGRYGFSTTAVLEPKGEGFAQADLGPHIHEALFAAVKRAQNDGLEVYPQFAIGPGPAIHVCAPASNNPKSLQGEETDCGLFLGTFDVASRKWTGSSARVIDLIENEVIQHDSPFEPANCAVAPDSFKETPEAEAPLQADDKILFRSAESEFKYLDQVLNDLYQILRELLPAAQFADIKRQQVAWLKTRDATDAAADRSKRTAERIAVLQKLLP